jgi:hypothetical protein
MLSGQHVNVFDSKILQWGPFNQVATPQRWANQNFSGIRESLPIIVKEWAGPGSGDRVNEFFLRVVQYCQVPKLFSG